MQEEKLFPEQRIKIKPKVNKLAGLVKKQQEKQKELVDSKKLLPLIFNNSYDIITLHQTDLRLTYLFVSPSIKVITDYKPEELLQKSLWEFVHPVDQKKITPLLEKYLQNGTKRSLKRKGITFPQKIIYRFRNKQGEWNYFESSISLVDSKFIFVTHDLTEFEKAKIDLKLSQEKFTSLFKSCPEALVYTNRDFKVIGLNPKFTKLFGYTWKEIKGKNINDLAIIPPDKIEESRTFIQKSFKKNISFETVRRNKEGKLIPVAISTSRVNIKGEFKGIIISYRDVSLYYNLLEGLKKSEKKYRDLFSNIPGGVYRIDNQGKITMMNTEGARLLGYASPQEVIGQNGEKVFYANPEDRKKYLQELEKNKGFLKDYEINLKRKDGTPLVISDTSHYYYDDEGKVAGIEGVFIDITERKEIEKELCYEQSLLHALLDHSLDSIYFKDRMKRFVRVNKRKAEKSKVTPEEMIGKTDFDFFSPDTAASSAQDEELVIESGKPLFNKEEKIIDKNQQVRWLSTTKVPWYNQEGKIMGLIGISRDITERKRSEQLQQVLYNISKAANSAISLDELYSTIHQELGTVIDTTNFHIALLNPKKVSIQYIYFVDQEDKLDNPLEVDPAGTLANYVMRTEQPLLADIDLINEMIAKGELIRSNLGTLTSQTVWLGVPLKVEDRVIGVMAVLSYTNPQLYSEKDIELLEFISSQIAIAIERKQVEERIKYLSFHDALTGVYNRAYFEEELKRYNISRYYPLSLVMLDVNGLKVVNDTFGHNNGDRLLKHSTYILSSVCRQGDILARMGGDEFAILLPSTDYKEASRFCDRIRKACREDKVKPEYLRVSFSMGQVTQQGEYRDFSSLFKEADQRMYQDKLLNSQIREKHFLEIFLHLLKKRDPHIAGKSSRIQKWAISLGEEVGLSKKELKNLKYLVLFHNLGKLNIPEDILSKVVNLTPSEEKIIKKHPLFGYRIANNFISLVPIAREILYQYEQWDGSGYPEGLKGEQIPLLSRIILLVNDYHMLRTLSFQEQALNKEEALQKIKKYAGTRYDPHLVKLFCKIIDEEN